MRALIMLAAKAWVCVAAGAAMAQVLPPSSPSPGARSTVPPAERSPFPPRRIPAVPPPGSTDQALLKPMIEDLDNGRYRIGAITVDKVQQQFSVPGHILRLGSRDSRLEFLVIAKDSEKSDESAVMVETDAVAFNVACILIGLDAAGAGQPQQRPDPRPGDGEPLQVTVSWQAKGRTVTRPASVLLRPSAGEPVTDDWVYTGSHFSADGVYAAHTTGTLIGFSRDPDSIIQHRAGLGLGGHGAVTYGGPDAPPAGTQVTITVSRAAQ